MKMIEVETRYHFVDKQEVFATLPFLRGVFDESNVWHTIHYGLEWFKQDIILRINEASRNGGPVKSMLGWKSPDMGQGVNIREEQEEEITHGIQGSAILQELGSQEVSFGAASEVKAELVRLSCLPFMEFSGNNEFGFYEPLSLSLKLMHCEQLAYPYLLEIEKTAHSEKEAMALAAELTAFTRQHHVADRQLKAEPPLLLYQAYEGYGR